MSTVDTGGPIPVTKVSFVYGGRPIWVATSDLQNPKRIQLTIYTRHGRRWDETPYADRVRRKWGSVPSTVHRDNIKGAQS